MIFMQGCMFSKKNWREFSALNPVKYTSLVGCPAYDLYEKNSDFLVTQEKKIDARDTRFC